MMFYSGLLMILFYFLKVGKLITLLPKPMISGFTTGAAVHVFCSQLKVVSGVDYQGHSGPGAIILNFIELVKSFEPGSEKIKYSSIMSFLVIIFMVFLKIINDKYRARLKNVPIPSEILVVVLSTIYCTQLDLGQKIDIVGEIPKGIPPPRLPDFLALPQIIPTTLIITITGYAVGVGIGQTLSKDTDSVQKFDSDLDLWANGLSNLIPSFFTCIPSHSSLSRSIVVKEAGGKTKVVGLVSSFIMALILLNFGPLFYSVPKPALSAIILFSISTMIKTCYDGFIEILNKDFKEGILWIISCFGVIFIDIVYGFGIGVVTSFVLLFYEKRKKPTSQKECENIEL